MHRLTEIVVIRRKNLARSSRPPETPSRATGPASSPRPSRVRTSPSCSPTSALVPPLLAPLPVVPLLVALLPLRRSPRKRSPRRTSIWEISSVVVMTTTEEVKLPL